MIDMKKFAYACIMVALLLAGCQQDESVFVAEDDEVVMVDYQVEINDGPQGRAIGDGNQIDELVVGIFRDDQLLTKLTFRDDADGVKDGKFHNIAIPMMKLETYDLVFWAQKAGNGIYRIDDSFNVAVDYAKYTYVSLFQVSGFEAFTAKREKVSVGNPGKKGIKLVRPFAQLNVASSQTGGVTRTELKVNKVYTLFNPLTGAVGGLAENPKFVFNNSTINEMLEIEGLEYGCLATIYLLPIAEAEVELTICQGNKLNVLNFKDVGLEANKRTNIVGNLLK